MTIAVVFSTFNTVSSYFSFNSGQVSGANVTETDDNPANYAFSYYIGNGVYSAAKKNITLLNMPFAYTDEQYSENPYTVRLPISLDYYNFYFNDIDGVDLPDNMATAFFVLGIEWHSPINEQSFFYFLC